MAKPTRPRYIRHRVYSRLRHGVNSLLKVFLDAQGARLASSATARSVIAADAPSDQLAIATHGWVTGDGPIIIESDDTLPGGIVDGQFYWPIFVNASSIRLATSRENAANGVYIDITSAGVGNMTATLASDGQAIMEQMRKGVPYDTIEATTDIDNL